MTEPLSIGKLVSTLRMHLRQYWLADADALLYKALAMRLSPLYLKMESLSRDMSHATSETYSEIRIVRRDLALLRKELKQRGVLSHELDGLIEIEGFHDKDPIIRDRREREPDDGAIPDGASVQ